MKIFKLNNESKRHYREALTIASDKVEDKKYIEDLKKAIEFNKELTDVQFATLYYAVALVESLYMQKEPKVLIATPESIKRNLDDYEDGLKSKLYGDLKQKLYITLILTKPNGYEFATGSLKYTDQEYAEMQNKIMNEIAAMIELASETLNINFNI